MRKTFAREPLPKHLETESGSLRGNLQQAKKSVRQVTASADELYQAVHRVEETLKKVETTTRALRRLRSENPSTTAFTHSVFQVSTSFVSQTTSTVAFVFVSWIFPSLERG
jgi:ABC-type transporter Mla subunit MlaD